MRGMMRFPLLIVAVLALAHSARAQARHDHAAADTVARVPALEKFHEVVFLIWHDAWPTKDTEKLTALVPDVTAGVAGIAGAQLHGMLREKKDAWERGVAELQSAAAAYTGAAKRGDAVQLLDAAEKLHARYEGLVRVIRPVLKEIDDFHATLYVLYHTYLPDTSLTNFTRAAGALTSKMAFLEKAALPERLKNKGDAFAAARKELGAAVASLNAAVATKDLTTVRAAVEEVHSRFETLTRVFE